MKNESVTLSAAKGLSNGVEILTCPGGRCQGRFAQNDGQVSR